MHHWPSVSTSLSVVLTSWSRCHNHAMSILLMMSFIYVKSNSFLFLVPLQFWFLILYSSASTLMQWSALQELCNQCVCSRCLYCHIFIDAVAFDFCPFSIYHLMSNTCYSPLFSSVICIYCYIQLLCPICLSEHSVSSIAIFGTPWTLGI